MLERCRLCRDPDAPCVESHIMPRFSYVRLRGEGPQDHPVHIRGGQAYLSQQQIKEPLLCRPCDEERLGKVESRVAALLPLRDGKPAPIVSKLGDVLATTENGSRVVSLGAVSGDDLAYFAASVTWRGHVSQHFPVQLGDTYAEQFRQYLLGKSGFPANAACVAYFYDVPFGGEVDVKATCVGVETYKRRPGARARWHGFMVLGLRFVMQLGKELDAGMVAACLVRQKQLFLSRQEHLATWLAPSILGAKADEDLDRRFGGRP